MRHIHSFILMFACSLLTGCTSIWEKSFDASPEFAGRRLPKAEYVDVRTIPFERYQRYVDAERRRRINSPYAEEDLSPEAQSAEKARLLDALQVRERDAAVLGWSEFTTNRRLSPSDPKLRDFAHKIGADLVVTTSAYAGQDVHYESQPVTTWSHGFTTYARPRWGYRGRYYYGGGPYTYQTTTWVPVLVSEDQFFYEAVYLRRGLQ